jgi:hypothetical protein
MKMLLAKKAFLIVILSFAFCFCVIRDIIIEREYTGDLRNRVVGARLQQKGIVPYFYKWDSADGIKYYDPQNFDSLKASNITGSPFLHQLFYPIANLPQKQISVIWLIIEYLMFISMVYIAYSFCSTLLQKIIMVVLAVSFLFTDAWRVGIAQGQIYLWIPFLLMLFYFFIKKGNEKRYIFLAGLCLISVILIRPNCIFFMAPFIFLIPKIKSKVAFFAPAVLITVFIFSSSFQRRIWIEYVKGVKEHVKIHQSKGPILQINHPKPDFKNWEGWNFSEINSHPVTKIRSENGNIFVLADRIFHIDLTAAMLLLISFITAIVLLVLFFIDKKKRKKTELLPIAILGFCLYMCSDFLSPVYRHSYYIVQWLFPVLLFAANYERKYKPYLTFLILALLLNIIHVHIPMSHTIGEYLMLVIFIAWSFKRKNEVVEFNPFYVL